jgi:hypothetical protein
MDLSLTKSARHEFLRLIAAAGAAALFRPQTEIAQPHDVRTRAIPSSGEALPVVGLGSWITFNVGDNQVARFDRPPDSKREPLHMTDVRDATIETGQAAEKVTLLLERLITLLESKSWNQRIATLAHPTDAVINAVFWRGAVLIGLLILGIGLLRMVPQRIAEKRRVKNRTERRPGEEADPFQKNL